MKNLNKITRFVIYILLMAGLLVGCSVNGEFCKSITDFLSTPVTQISVGDLMVVLFIIGLLTRS